MAEIEFKWLMEPYIISQNLVLEKNTAVVVDPHISYMRPRAGGAEELVMEIPMRPPMKFEADKTVGCRIYKLPGLIFLIPEILLADKPVAS